MFDNPHYCCLILVSILSGKVLGIVLSKLFFIALWYFLVSLWASIFQDDYESSRFHSFHYVSSISNPGM